MPVTINVNGLSLCHKGSDGLTIATAPDVCLTPPVPLPVPYPNVAFSADLAGGTTTVLADGGNSIAHRPSIFATSIGDEPGVLGGVKSGTVLKEASWLTFSADVLIEGQAACRLTDKMLHNHGNTVNCGGELQKAIKTAPIDCNKAWAEVHAKVNRIANIQDPVARNAAITQQYSQIYQKNPELKWSGMGAIVSRNAGCNLVEAKKIWDKQRSIADVLDPSKQPWYAPADESSTMAWSLAATQADLAKTMYLGLGDANKAIFQDIFPKFLFYSNYGLDALKRCAAAGGVSPEMLKAFEDFASKDPQRIENATMAVAKQEQLVTLENVLKRNTALKDAMNTNKTTYDWYVGRPFGAKRPDVFMSATCGRGPIVEFNGSLTDANDRLDMARKISQAFGQLQKDYPQWFNNQFMSLSGVAGPPYPTNSVPPSEMTLPK